MERHFEKDLNELKERLLWMGSLAERAVHQAVHAVLDSDEQLAKRVLDEEDASCNWKSTTASCSYWPCTS
jgi:phosphate transport system protein